MMCDTILSFAIIMTREYTITLSNLKRRVLPSLDCRPG